MNVKEALGWIGLLLVLGIIAYWAINYYSSEYTKTKPKINPAKPE